MDKTIMAKYNRPQIIQFFISLISLTLFSLTMSGVAHAEGNCPPGYYPVGGQGVQGCAPIPNYGSSGGYSAPSYRTPSTEGYVATGTNGVIGVATAKIFRGKLEEKALQACEKKGGTDCRIWFTYDDNHCATIGQAEGTNRLYKARTTAGEVSDVVPMLVPGSRKALGRKKVLEACRYDGFPEAQCKIIYEDCRRLNLP